MYLSSFAVNVQHQHPIKFNLQWQFVDAQCTPMQLKLNKECLPVMHNLNKHFVCWIYCPCKESVFQYTIVVSAVAAPSVARWSDGPWGWGPNLQFNAINFVGWARTGGMLACEGWRENREILDLLWVTLEESSNIYSCECDVSTRDCTKDKTSKSLQLI